MKPTHFKTDKGETFDVEVVKTNKRSLVVSLTNKGKLIKQIKVSKKSKKFLYKGEENGKTV